METGTVRVKLFVATLILTFIYAENNAAAVSLAGDRETCEVEGERIPVDNIDKQKCYYCICENGYVRCEKTCPDVDGCYMLIEKSQDECCDKCQGCFYNGKLHDSGTEWIDPMKPCSTMRCEAGVVTKTEMLCHIPCDNPFPPALGKCCPTCPDCSINGQMASDDLDITSGDLCVKCSCRKGNMTCSKRACPVLHCNPIYQKQDAGECCPRCVGNRSLNQPPKRCFLGNKMYKEGDSFPTDLCTKCTCASETIICERKTCPVLDCATDFQKKKKNGCCKECVVPDIEEVRSQCTLEGKTYKEGQSWALNPCISCKCHDGKINCAKMVCKTPATCPQGTRHVHKEGECCDKCEEIQSEAACMVFGDGHHKTFDGKIFTFQGLGKYQLVSDCHNHSFSVRITNDFSNFNRTSVTTKRVRVKYGNTRINLGQKFRVRIDGVRADVPYNKLGSLSIEKQDHSLFMVMDNAVKILWNNQGFLEVVVPSSYKRKLCGLCGNYNGDVHDDLKLRKGPVLDELNLLKFGGSWCVGKDCAKQSTRTSKIQTCKPKAPKIRNGKSPCKVLNAYPFEKCDSKLIADKYSKACNKDMCDCPNGKCYCASLMAYVQECKRMGVLIRNWEGSSLCFLSAFARSRPKPKHKSQPFSSADILMYSNRTMRKNKGNEPIIH